MEKRIIALLLCLLCVHANDFCRPDNVKITHDEDYNFAYNYGIAVANDKIYLGFYIETEDGDGGFDYESIIVQSNFEGNNICSFANYDLNIDILHANSEFVLGIGYGVTILPTDICSATDG